MMKNQKRFFPRNYLIFYVILLNNISQCCIFYLNLLRFFLILQNFVLHKRFIMFFSFGILLKNLANRQTYFVFKKASFLSGENLFYLKINRKNNITIKLLNKKTLKHYFSVLFFSTTINIFFSNFFF